MSIRNLLLAWNRTNGLTIFGISAVLGVSVFAVSRFLNSRQRAVKPLEEDEIMRLESFDLFGLPTRKLQQLVQSLHEEMDRGLRGEKSTLKMLPSFVNNPSGEESGTFYALDLGGTNFRVIRLELKGGRVIGASEKKSFTISKELMTGTAEDLFDFIANCIETFVSSNNKDLLTQGKLVLGFTFSFPVNQTAIANGILIQWNKGFNIPSAVGHDVVDLLNAAFRKKNISVEVAALVNDTVGTMVARRYVDPKCEMGVILGTGTNAAYYEEISKIKKLTTPTTMQGMIINMEWGGFGDGTQYLPLTKVDKQLDETSVNPGKQLFEKMISGMYLGEVVRLILLDLLAKGRIFVGVSSLKQKFESAHITRVLKDYTDDFAEIGKLLAEVFDIQNSIQADRKLLKGICSVVANRAARLSATAIAAVCSKTNKLHCTVAVDGSLFEFMPLFKTKMEETIKELYPESDIQLILANDGSGIGAAIIAATVSNSQ